jgi:hypothetical protein
MSETLLRDRVELEKQRDAEAKLNRIAAVEKSTAVLQAIFDNVFKHFQEALERAVDGDDLKELKREMEDEMAKQIQHICDHLTTQNAQQSNDLLTKVGAMFTDQKIAMANDQIANQNAILKANDDTRREIIRYGIGFALTVLASLAVIWLSP